MIKQIRSTTWWSKDGLATAPFPAEEITKASEELAKAEANGFLFCAAVFTANVFDSIHTKAHPTDGHLDWGRGETYKRFIFADGKMTKDPTYPAPVPLKAWEAHGLQCRVYANGIGYNCGYVAVPESHPWYRKGYGACLDPACGKDWHYDCAVQGRLEVHGGVTFAGEWWSDGQWWFGFDCAHSGDAPDPQWVREKRERDPDYYVSMFDHGMFWSVDMVAHETEEMARQLSEAPNV